MASLRSWGVEHGYRYDGSPVIAHEPSAKPVDPLVYEPNTTPGARLPHVFLGPDDSIHDRLGLYFSLVVIDVDEDVSAFENAAIALGIPLQIVKIERPDLIHIYQRKLILVRPDQHIAWRSDHMPNEAAAILRKAVGA